jgi:hypothetical protein
MSLREMDGGGRLREVLYLPHLDDFERTWFVIGTPDRAAIEAEINARLDHLVTSPDPNRGSITNTSIEGRKLNPVTGINRNQGRLERHGLRCYLRGLQPERESRRHVLWECVEESDYRKGRPLDRHAR